MTSNLHIVILAAGQGTRMKSARPKVLQTLAGQPLLGHVLATARALKPAGIHVVIGHGAEQVRAAFADAPDLNWVLQAEQLGTGHAVAEALPGIRDDATVLVLYGDVPLTPAATLQGLVEACDGSGRLAILGVHLADPHGYGRIVRDAQGDVVAIVEHKDASDEQLAIDEVNTGILAAPARELRGWVGRLSSDNAQGEYYLTDCVALAVNDGQSVASAHSREPDDVAGVNDRVQLAALERILQRRRAGALMRDGAQILDPARLDVRGQVTVGRDCVIDVGVVFNGTVTLGDGVRVGPYCVLSDVTIADGATIDAHSVLENCEIGPEASVGPFARVRPGTRLGRGAKVGNFVETKKADVGEGSKINHLSYVGDATIGVGVNVGAGTITCNYDGVNKHRTVIEDGAFIGSDTALVAPVTVGKNATIGAGSVVTRDAPADQLTVARGRQKSIPGWQRPSKSD